MAMLNRTRRSPNCIGCHSRKSSMFCNLSEEALIDFDRLGVQMTVPKGAVLFHEDDVSSAVFVLCEGQAKLYCTSKEGKTMIAKIAAEGDVLGLSAVVSGGRYEVTAETLVPTVVKTLHRDAFLGFIERCGEASMHAAQALSEEYKTAFFDARRLALAPSVAGRLATVLLDWGKTASCGKAEIRFKMAMTHEELANMAGTSRETVTRLLGRFRREKLIEIHGTSILIVQPDRLAMLG